MSDPVLLEVCVDSVESALAAERGGAHRVELCSNLLEGGVTPSAGQIATVRHRVSIGLYVMIRPRGGDFCYSADEFETMEQDVLTARQLGADGIVFGILKQDGQVDIDRTRHLVKIARPLRVTFHRAFDMSIDLSQALEDIIDAGVDRVLTSGGEQTVAEGTTTVRQLVRAAKGRLIVMAGSGIAEGNVRRIIAQTGISEIHASVKVPVPSPMQYRKERISIGSIRGREYQRTLVLEDRVQRLLAATSNGNMRRAKAQLKSVKR